MRICNRCDLEFECTTRHKTCIKCRHQLYKKIHNKRCECGNLIQFKSIKCLSCFNRDTAKFRAAKPVGTKIKDQKGYILIKLPYIHPRTLKSRAGWIYEHIHIMEEKLGRYLFMEENVHHKNGIKDDNRIENLELWTRPQPSGIRVEDAIKWAKQILERYQDLNIN